MAIPQNFTLPARTTFPEAKPIIIPNLKPPLNATLISGPSGLPALQSYFDRKKIICMDFETNVVTSFFYRRIRTMQFGDREEQYVVDLAGFSNDIYASQGGYKPDLVAYGPLLDILRPVLESKTWEKVVFAGEFEYICAKWCLGLRVYGMYDIFLAEKLLYAGYVEFLKSGFWSLKDLVKRYKGLEMSKVEQTSFNLTDPLTEDQLCYAALDVRIPMSIIPRQREDLTRANLDRVAQIEFDAIPGFGDLHLNGLLLDEQEWMRLIGLVEAEKGETIRKLDEILLPVVGAPEEVFHDLEKMEEEWKNCEDRELRKEKRELFVAARQEVSKCKRDATKQEGQSRINYKSNPQLKAALLQLGLDPKTLPDTSDETLKKLAGIEVIDLLRTLRGQTKLLTTYGPYVKQVDRNTGRLHPRFNQLGAATGRPTCNKPNCYNLPSGEEWRSCFKARPRHKMITIDYAGQELRILAEASKDPLLLRAFDLGADPHSMVASLMFDNFMQVAQPDCAYVKAKQKCECPQHKILRKKVKAINFGIIYGMAEYRLGLELGIPTIEARALIRKYKSALKTATEHLSKRGLDAYQNKASFTLLNRRRLFKMPTLQDATMRVLEDLHGKKALKEKNLPPVALNQAQKRLMGMKASIKREGTNSEIQGTGADMLKLAMGSGFDSEGKPFLWHLLEKEGAFLENNVYDELLVEAPEDKAEAVMELVADCMIRAAKEMVKRVPFAYEAHIDTCWRK